MIPLQDARIRLQTRLAKEAEEKARKEAEEKAHLEEEQRIKEAEEKAVAEAVVAAAAAAAEAEAKAKTEAEEAAHIADALTQGEQSNSGFTPLVLKTLEELQKEQQVQQQPPQQRAQKAGCQVKRGMTDCQFDRPPVTYTVLFRRLKDIGLVQPRILVPVGLNRRPANYDENARCEFHSGAPGHHVDGCRDFKHAVQDLVDSKAINFAPTPNVDANPVPMHGPMGVNVMSKDKRKMEETNVDQIRTPMSEV
ncbi:uncharacterized protein LOC127096049 [Lathyrus oleraceus]|uniref:uncharacterized protein LOC127096049 n=1 Tax=Pisum sativum TaxID=3888 RepID=UPI0021D1FF81|nr:uncharacterized protein LOC127096049 [Pisum sativum]